MKPEDYSERTVEVRGWRVHVVSYKLGDRYVSTADNVDPGARIARETGASKQEAETAVLAKAEQRLARTKVHKS